MKRYSVNFMKGSVMHTEKVGINDEHTWVLPKGVTIDDTKLYIVEYNTSYPSDPSDMSSHTVVYSLEEVPDDILYAMHQEMYYSKIIENYKKKFINE